MSFSGMLTAASVHRGAAEAPRGTGACSAGEEDEAMSRLALAMGVSCLATISGPAAQEEARVRALRRAQLLAALKEKTAGIPEASQLWEEFDTIEQVSVALFLGPSLLLGLVRILTALVPCRRRTTTP